MLLRKSWLIAFLSAAVIGVTPVTASEAKDSLALASAWEITSVDPAISGFALQRLQIQENLVDADSEGTLRPGLATEWSTSEDGLTWRFTLRKNVSFHDGTPFDAVAAVSALQRAAEQPGILENAPLGDITADGNAVVIRGGNLLYPKQYPFQYPRNHGKLVLSASDAFPNRLT